MNEGESLEHVHPGFKKFKPVGRTKKPRPGASFNEYKREDVVFFISLVEQSPALWDVEHPCFSRRDYKNRLFDGIEEECRVFMARGRTHGKCAQFLWANLLFNYRRETDKVMNGESGSDGESLDVPFPYVEEMSFLDEDQDQRKIAEDFVLEPDLVEFMEPPEGVDDRVAELARRKKRSAQIEEVMGEFKKTSNLIASAIDTVINEPEPSTCDKTRVCAYIRDHLASLSELDELREEARIIAFVEGLKHEKRVVSPNGAGTSAAVDSNLERAKTGEIIVPNFVKLETASIKNPMLKIEKMLECLPKTNRNRYKRMTKEELLLFDIGRAVFDVNMLSMKKFMEKESSQCTNSGEARRLDALRKVLNDALIEDEAKCSTEQMIDGSRLFEADDIPKLDENGPEKSTKDQERETFIAKLIKENKDLKDQIATKENEKPAELEKPQPPPQRAPARTFDVNQPSTSQPVPQVTNDLLQNNSQFSKSIIDAHMAKWADLASQVLYYPKTFFRFMEIKCYLGNRNDPDLVTQVKVENLLLWMIKGRCIVRGDETIPVNFAKEVFVKELRIANLKWLKELKLDATNYVNDLIKMNNELLIDQLLRYDSESAISNRANILVLERIACLAILQYPGTKITSDRLNFQNADLKNRAILLLKTKKLINIVIGRITGVFLTFLEKQESLDLIQKSLDFFGIRASTYLVFLQNRNEAPVADFCFNATATTMMMQPKRLQKSIISMVNTRKPFTPATTTTKSGNSPVWNHRIASTLQPKFRVIVTRPRVARPAATASSVDSVGVEPPPAKIPCLSMGGVAPCTIRVAPTVQKAASCEKPVKVEELDNEQLVTVKQEGDDNYRTH